MTVRILLGDCLQKLQLLKDNSVDAVVTDPPYGLSFMGKKWDYDVPSVAIWEQCLRVLKPGGHLLAFAGTRTQHRMACRIEDAGFEIRDMIAWVYGSGFPKSHDVAKAVHANKTIGGSSPRNRRQAMMGSGYIPGETKGHINKERAMERLRSDAKPMSVDCLFPEAQRWQGWGTALKPALEPITVARKPLIGTVAENVLAYGTGAINVDGCRVEHITVGDGNLALNPHLRTHINGGNGGNIIAHENDRRVVMPNVLGRWPANLIHDGSDEVTGLFPGEQGSSVARFFYCAKASKKDRGEGNSHPTVKPIALMRYLCRLVTPPDGTILDPFMGSGSTGVAATLEKLNFIGIELLREHFETSKRRIIEAKGTK